MTRNRVTKLLGAACIGGITAAEHLSLPSVLLILFIYAVAVELRGE